MFILGMFNKKDTLQETPPWKQDINRLKSALGGDMLVFWDV